VCEEAAFPQDAVRRPWAVSDDGGSRLALQALSRWAPGSTSTASLGVDLAKLTMEAKGCLPT